MYSSLVPAARFKIASCVNGWIGGKNVAENKSMQPAGLNERDGCLLPNKEGARHKCCA